MIRVLHLRKTYQHQTVLEGINFEVRIGEVVGFLGPNGAGKTTTLRILMGFVAPSSGEVRIGDHRLPEDSLKARRVIGYLAENNPLYDSLRVYEYLIFVARMKRLRHIEDAVRSVVRTCSLSEKITNSIGALSKGYRQRVGLAAAFLGNPDYLILDEPTSGLDPNQSRDIRKLIREMGRDKAVIFSSHILGEVQAVCDRVLILHQGRLVAESPMAALQGSIKQIVKIRLNIDGPEQAVMQALQNISGIQQVQCLKTQQYSVVSRFSSEQVNREIFKLCAQKGWVLSKMEESEASLDEIFQKLTES